LAEHLPNAMLLTYLDAGHDSLFQFHEREPACHHRADRGSRTRRRQRGRLACDMRFAARETAILAQAEPAGAAHTAKNVGKHNGGEARHVYCGEGEITRHPARV